MRHLYFIIAVITMLFSCSNIMAQSDAEIRRKINEAAASLHTIQCDFVQTKHIKLLGKEMVSHGTMNFQQPNKLRWHYTTPYDYIFLLNDTQVQIVKGGRADVIDVNQSKVFKEIVRIMMNSMTGRCIDNDKDFRTTITTTDKEWIAHMTPLKKELKRMFSSIVLHVSHQDRIVTVVELKEPNGDNTLIELKNIKQNQPIDASTFIIHK